MTASRSTRSGASIRYPDWLGGLQVEAVLARYRAGVLTPVDLIESIYDRIESRGDDSVWIHLVPRADAVFAASQLPAIATSELPLHGIPFAVKDNFDVAGMPTTAGCAEFAYIAGETATPIGLLIAAGALLIGKTNLDQFATGLNGTRSPYGVPSTPFDPTMISGGSSSGSAVAVSAGLVSFALGTDTAGSGRVPAAFTSVVGVKPTRGLVSNAGMVPACRSLDCVTTFALTVSDGARVLATMAGPDSLDPWSRNLPRPPREVTPTALGGVVLGVPRESDLGIEAESGYLPVWAALLDRLSRAGASVVPIDMRPFFEAGQLLYGGPWLAERLSGLETFVREHPDAMLPVTRSLLEAGFAVTGTQVFLGLNELQRLRACVTPALAAVDAILTPTVPVTYSIEAMLADPVARNSALGRFTNFANLLDLAAVALPAGITAGALPFGVSLLGVAGTDAALLGLAATMEQLLDLPLGATGETRIDATTSSSMSDRGVSSARPPSSAAALNIAVVGAHLQGMPLNDQLRTLGASLLAITTTAPLYRLFNLTGTIPPKPGLVRVGAGGGGAEIEVELYSLPLGSVGRFLATVASPLAIGTVVLANGAQVHGFLCEPAGLEGAEDITAHGGWRAYRATKGEDFVEDDSRRR